MKMIIATGKRYNGIDYQKEFNVKRRTLHLNLKGLKTVDLDNLRYCYNLRRLVISNIDTENTIALSSLKDSILLRTLIIRKAYSLEPSLDFLSNSRKLRKVRIRFTNIEELDLSPLSQCTNLRVLNLSDNLINSINLAPLSNCRKLRRIVLVENKFEELNLTPLMNNRKLLSLILRKNRLKKIDLTPLTNHQKITNINLTNNQLEELNLTPLKYCKNLSQLLIDSNTKLIWDETHFQFETGMAPGLATYAPRLNQSASITSFVQQEIESRRSRREMVMREEHLKQLTIAKSAHVHKCLKCKAEIKVYNREEDKICKECETEIEYCSICQRGLFYEDDVVREENCENLFHRSHLIAWIQAQGTCPICKERINEKNLVTV